MKTFMIIVAAIAAIATPVSASGGPEPMGTSLLVIFFLAFGALIVVFQTIPGLVLFFSMMKGLFTMRAKKSLPDPVETKTSA